MLKLGSDWPGEERIQVLVRSSAGLFIWASTAVKFIEGGYHPDQQLDILLHPHPRAAEFALDALHATALDADGKWSRDEVSADSRAILGAIVTAREPLSDTMLDHILGLDGPRSSYFILLRLRCLLQWSPGQPIWILHTSFVDYLTESDWRMSLQWSALVHWYIIPPPTSCSCMLANYEGEMKFNICGLETSHVSNDEVPDLPACIQSYIPDHLYYSCRFWADHLRETDFEVDFFPFLNDFFCHQLLYWLEVLSLTKAVPVASPALLSIVDCVGVSASAENWHVRRWQLILVLKHYNLDIAKMAADANMFVITFRYPMSKSAPHTYISGVPFSPTETMVSK